MKKRVREVRPGDWIVLTGAADTRSLRPQMVTIDGTEYPAFVDGRDLRLRCPGVAPGTHVVALGSAPVLRIMVPAT